MPSSIKNLNQSIQIQSQSKIYVDNILDRVKSVIKKSRSNSEISKKSMNRIKEIKEENQVNKKARFSQLKQDMKENLSRSRELKSKLASSSVKKKQGDVVVSDFAKSVLDFQGRIERMIKDSYKNKLYRSKNSVLSHTYNSAE